MKALFLLLLFFSSACFSNMIITYRNSDSVNNARFNYELQLLELALSKTITEYGDYTLQPSPTMNTTRSLNSVERNTYTNFFMLATYKSIYDKTMDYVPFPLQRGIVGYRVFITTKEGQAKLDKLQTKEQLKQLKVVQGKGWQDVAILRNNGFKTTTIDNYFSLFQFLSHNRTDIFPRGVSEYEFELSYHSENISNLVLDNKYALYYEFPRFFYTNKNNTRAKQRIYDGLKKAWEDGSFVQLWERYHLDTIKKARLSNREILELENSEVSHISDDIAKYLYRVH